MVEKFTFASLVMTPGVVLMCLLVLVHWGPSTWESIKTRTMDAQDWLIAGIVIGFLGGMGDNLYWAIAWHLDYTDHPLRDWFFSHGSVSNLFFRQGMGFTAGLCHVVSSYMLASRRTAPRVAGVMIASILLGFIYAMSLVMGFKLPSDPLEMTLAINQIAIPALYMAFASQVVISLSRVKDIDPSKAWALGRLAAVFTTCSIAGYVSHILMNHGGVSLFMVISHSIVSALMLRVIWRGKDAEFLAGSTAVDV